MPSSIDSSGSSDVTAELQSLINKAPNGSTIVFRAGGRYKLGTSLIINGRRDLTLDGNGARLDIPRTDMSSMRSAGIQVRDGARGTTIRDFTLVGGNAQAGTSKAFEGRESNHGIAVLSANDTLIERVTIQRTGADCLYVNRSASGGRSVGVTFRDSTCRLSGRHGVGLIGGDDVRIVNNTFDDIGFDVVDIEPQRRRTFGETLFVRPRLTAFLDQEVRTAEAKTRQRFLLPFPFEAEQVSVEIEAGFVILGEEDDAGLPVARRHRARPRNPAKSSVT